VDGKVYEFTGRAIGPASEQSYVRLYYDSNSPSRASFGDKTSVSTVAIPVLSLFLAIGCFAMIPFAAKISEATVHVEWAQRSSQQSSQPRTRTRDGLQGMLPTLIPTLVPGLVACASALLIAGVAVSAVSALVRRNSGDHSQYDIENLTKPAPGGNSTDSRFSSWLSAQKFQAEFERQKEQKQFPAKIEGRNFDGTDQYRAVYQSQKVAWATHFGQDSAGFKQNDTKYRAMGYEPTSHNQFLDAKGTLRIQTTWTGTGKERGKPVSQPPRSQSRFPER
jgi:hypothetical protein